MPTGQELAWVCEEPSYEVNYYSKNGFKLCHEQKRMSDIRRAYYLMIGDKETAEKYKVDVRHEYKAKLKMKVINASQFVSGEWV